MFVNLFFSSTLRFDRLVQVLHTQQKNAKYIMIMIIQMFVLQVICLETERGAKTGEFMFPYNFLHFYYYCYWMTAFKTKTYCIFDIKKV